MDSLAVAIEAWAWNVPGLMAEERFVLLAIVRGGEVEPNLREISERTGLGPNITRTAALRLVERGILTDEFRPIER